MSATYPQRPKVFALKYVRLLTKKVVANELGPQVFTLLTVIAATEDARGYTDAVNFYNHQLMPLIGAGSEDTLNRVREKAVKAGWLSYTAGGKGIPGIYFVTIPKKYQGTDDAPTDEGHDEISTRTDAGTSAEVSAGAADLPPHGCGENPRTSAGRTRGQPEDKCGPLIPVPVPITNTPLPPAGGSASRTAETTKPKPKKPKKPAEGDPLFAKFYAAYPRKAAKAKAAAAFAKLNPTDDLLAVMLRAIAWQANTEQWTKDDGNFIPYPATWLNARRWEDEPPTASAPDLSSAAVGYSPRLDELQPPMRRP